MEDTRKMTCDMCRKAVPISQMHYLAKGGESVMALCSACKNKKTAEKKKPDEKQTVKKEIYICGNCSYKFKFKHDGVTNLKCPYCGRSDKLTR